MRDLTLRDVATLPKRVKALCVAASAAAAFAFSHLLVLADLRAEHLATQRQAATLGAQRDQKANAAETRAAAEARHATAKTAFAALLAELPSDARTRGLVADITRAAVARGLAVGNIALAAEREAPLFAERPIDITASGDYHHMGGFVADLAALPVLVALLEFELRAPPSGNGAALELTATAYTYRYREPLDIAPAASPPARRARPGYRSEGRRNPFSVAGAAAAAGASAPMLARTRQPLERHPLADLRMVGTVAAAGRRHALIRDPQGGVHRLAVGDYLGLDHGQVSAVRETGLDLVETVHAGAGGGWLARPRTLALTAQPEAASETPRPAAAPTSTTP